MSFLRFSDSFQLELWLHTPSPAEALVKALTEIVGALPATLPRVQSMLLDLLSLVLARKPISSSASSSTLQTLQAALAAGELQGAAMTRLALATLGSFSFVPYPLLDFVRDYVLPYLDDNDAAIRKAAALAACHVVEQHVLYSRRPGGKIPSAEHRAIDKVGAARGALAVLSGIAMLDLSHLGHASRQPQFLPRSPTASPHHPPPSSWPWPCPISLADCPAPAVLGGG